MADSGRALPNEVGILPAFLGPWTVTGPWHHEQGYPQTWAVQSPWRTIAECPTREGAEQIAAALTEAEARSS